jgi:hypothetical protein
MVYASRRTELLLAGDCLSSLGSAVGDLQHHGTALIFDRIATFRLDHGMAKCTLIGDRSCECALAAVIRIMLLMFPETPSADRVSIEIAIASMC